MSGQLVVQHAAPRLGGSSLGSLAQARRPPLGNGSAAARPTPWHIFAGESPPFTRLDLVNLAGRSVRVRSHFLGIVKGHDLGLSREDVAVHINQLDLQLVLSGRQRFAPYHVSMFATLLPVTGRRDPN